MNMIINKRVIGGIIGFTSALYEHRAYFTGPKSQEEYDKTRYIIIERTILYSIFGHLCDIMPFFELTYFSPFHYLLFLGLTVK